MPPSLPTIVAGLRRGVILESHLVSASGGGYQWCQGSTAVMATTANKSVRYTIDKGNRRIGAGALPAAIRLGGSKSHARFSRGDGASSRGAFGTGARMKGPAGRDGLVGTRLG
jgi:hypothetical protein